MIRLPLAFNNDKANIWKELLILEMCVWLLANQNRKSIVWPLRWIRLFISFTVHISRETVWGRGYRLPCFPNGYSLVSSTHILLGKEKMQLTHSWRHAGITKRHIERSQYVFLSETCGLAKTLAWCYRWLKLCYAKEQGSWRKYGAHVLFTAEAKSSCFSVTLWV